MKIFMTLILSLIAFQVMAQSDIRINVLGNLEWANSKYTLEYSFEIDSLKEKYAPGYSAGIELEMDLGKGVAFSGGLYYAKMNIKPGLDLGAFYGAAFPINDTLSVYMNGPYLARHEFSMIRLPFQFKKYFGKGTRLSGYLLTGMTIGFQFDELEAFKDKYHFISSNEFWVNEFEARNSEFKFMNSSIDLGAGIRYKLCAGWNVLLQSKVSALEFRSENEKFKKNGEIMWDDQLLWLGQVSLGLGLQRSF